MKINLNNYTIKTKILALALSSAIGVSTVAMLVLLFSSKQMSELMVDNFQSSTNKNLDNLVSNVYKSCEITDQLLNRVLNHKLEQAKDLIKKKGGISFSAEKTNWECINQLSKEKSDVNLAKLTIGGVWIGKNDNFDIYQQVVDDLKEDKFTFTIFQRINEKGDMLRVATNVKLENGKRAIGTYIPALNLEGNQNPIIEKVLSGNNYYGNAYVVNDYYQSIYEPIKDNNGNITGMLYAGVSLNLTNKLRESIINTTVGKTGYMYVLGAKGTRKGHYIISKGGERDGENIWNAKDDNGELVIQKIINQALTSPQGKVSQIFYPWKNKGDSVAKVKIVSIAYFEPFDWVIGAGTNLEELEESSTIIYSSFNQIYLYFGIALFISLLGITITGIYITNKIANPIKSAITILNHIANGDISAANKETDNLERMYHGK